MEVRNEASNGWAIELLVVGILLLSMAALFFLWTYLSGYEPSGSQSSVYLALSRRGAPFASGWSEAS